MAKTATKIKAGTSQPDNPRVKIGSNSGNLERIFDDIEPPKNEITLANLTRLAEKAADMQRRKEDLEAMLSALSSDLHSICSKEIPDAMMQLKLADFKLQDGSKVAVKDILSGSLPKDEELRAQALAFVRAQGAEDLIKRSFSFDLGRNSDKLAEKVGAALRKLKIDFTDKMDIHAQTLAKFARERLENGELVPLDMLGLYAGKLAKITLAPKK